MREVDSRLEFIEISFGRFASFIAIGLVVVVVVVVVSQLAVRGDEC
jgi:hypothetical protein